MDDFDGDIFGLDDRLLRWYVTDVWRGQAAYLPSFCRLTLLGSLSAGPLSLLANGRVVQRWHVGIIADLGAEGGGSGCEVCGCGTIGGG